MRAHALILGLVAFACYANAELQDDGYRYQKPGPKFNEGNEESNEIIKGQPIGTKSSFSASSSHSISDDRHLPNNIVSGVVNTISSVGSGLHSNAGFNVHAGAVNQLGSSNAGQTQGGYWWMNQGSPFKPQGGAAISGNFGTGAQGGSFTSSSSTSSSSATSGGSGANTGNPFLGGVQGHFGIGSQAGSNAGSSGQSGFGGSFGVSNQIGAGIGSTQGGSQGSFGGNFGTGVGNIGSAISGAVGQAISQAGTIGGHFGFGSQAGTGASTGAQAGFGGNFGTQGGSQSGSQSTTQGGSSHGSHESSSSHGGSHHTGSQGSTQSGHFGGSSQGSHGGSHHTGSHGSVQGGTQSGANHGGHFGTSSHGSHGAHGGASHGSHSGSHSSIHGATHGGSHGTSSHGSHSSSHGSHNSHFESSSSHGSHNSHFETSTSTHGSQAGFNSGAQTNAAVNGYPSIKPNKPFVTGHTIPCNGEGKICVSKHKCVNGYVTLTGISQVAQQNQKCDVASEVCCTLQKPTPIPEQEANNGYLPPIGTSPSDDSPNYAYPPPPPPEEEEDDGLHNDGEPTGLNPSIAFPPAPKAQPQLGCAAALLCVEEQYCSMTGVISKTPIVLNEQQLLRRVPMVDCRNPDNGVTGKCCRDPDYVDPWPAGNLSPKELSLGFDDQGFPKFLNLTKSKPKKPVQPIQTLQPLRPLQPQQSIKVTPQQPSIGFQPFKPIVSVQPQSTSQFTKFTPGPQESKFFDNSQFTIAQSTKFGEKIVPAPGQPQIIETFQPERPQSFVPVTRPEQPQAFIPKRPEQTSSFVPAKRPEVIVVPQQPEQFQPEQPDVFAHQQEATFQQEHSNVFIPEQPEQHQGFVHQKFEHGKVVVPSGPQSNLVVVDQTFKYKPTQSVKFDHTEKSIAGLPTFSQLQDNFNEQFPNVQNIPNQIATSISNFNPFKPQESIPEVQQDTETVNGPAEVPESPLPTTTRKPFFSNINFPNINLPTFSLPSLPSFPNFGNTEKGRVVESVTVPEAPVIFSSYTPGSKCGVVNKVQHSYQLESDEAAFGEITWQAMVLNNIEKKLLCSGAVVAPNVVLTAAHCVYGIKPSEVSIKVGEWKLGYELKHEEPLPFEIVKVESIVAHPNYKPGFSAYDTAILYLEHPVRLEQHVDTICVAETPVVTPQRKCISTGWGKVAVQYHAAGALMHKIDVDVISNDQCRQRLQSAESQIDIDDSLVCTKAHKQNNNMCQVDVGGPLACERGDGSYELVGIYSQDTGCLPTNQVATFALIDSEWVHEMIGSGPRGLEQHPQQTPSRYHYHQPGVPCDCQQSSLPAGSNRYLPPF